MLSPAEDSFLIAGAVLITGCFFAGQNIGYRGIFLLPLFPGLFALSGFGTGTRQRGNYEPLIAAILLTGAVALACYLTARHTGLNPQGVVYGGVGLAVLGTMAFGSFHYFKIDLPTIALATSWALGGIGGFLANWIHQKFGID